MYALVMTKRNDSNTLVKLFRNKEDVEKEMISRYNNYLKKAEKIDWRYTFFDSDQWYGSVDDWESQTELRCCEIADAAVL